MTTIIGEIGYAFFFKLTATSRSGGFARGQKKKGGDARTTFTGMMNISDRSKTMLAENLTWQEYEEEIGKRIVILPLGALEQHGPHLPLNVDVVIPRKRI